MWPTLTEAVMQTLGVQPREAYVFAKHIQNNKNKDKASSPGVSSHFRCTYNMPYVHFPFIDLLGLLYIPQRNKQFSTKDALKQKKLKSFLCPPLEWFRADHMI